MAHNVRLLVEYSGELFRGWQRQDGVRTVQGELEDAIATVARADARKLELEIVPDVTLIGSGRTDAGVHARAQVANFLWPEELPLDLERLRGSLNGITGHDLVVREASEVDAAFDARHAPHCKAYSYGIVLRNYSLGLHAGRAWRVSPGDLNIAKMIEAAKIFKGQHDFQSFRASDCTAKSTVRTVLASELTRVDEERLVYTIIGKGFLKQMVRIIVGTLVEVGRERLSVAGVREVLAARDRTLAGMTAPASGLVLEWVRYGEEFERGGV